MKLVNSNLTQRDRDIGYTLHRVIGDLERQGPRELCETRVALATAATPVFRASHPKYAKSVVRPGTVRRLWRLSLDDANGLPIFGWNGTHYSTNARDVREWFGRNADSRASSGERDQAEVVESVRANGTKEELNTHLRRIAQVEERRTELVSAVQREARGRVSPTAQKHLLGRIGADFDSLRRNLGFLDDETTAA